MSDNLKNEPKLNLLTLKIENNEKANKELQKNLRLTTSGNLPWIIGFFTIITIIYLVIYLITTDDNAFFYIEFNGGCTGMFVLNYLCTKKFPWMDNCFTIVSFTLFLAFYYYG